MLKLKTCQQCNNIFTPRNDSPGIFCSKSCNATYHNSRRSKNKKTLINCCLNCKKEIINNNKFCGHSCSAIFNNKLRSSVLVVKPCPQCSIKFASNNKFCSKRCGWDNKKKPIEYHKAKQREVYRRYIAKKKYQTPIGEDIKLIQQFYLECPVGYEVDHIIPISRGGHHSLQNLQYLTKLENRRKSNKIL
jgi:5-methylcytosine-specific restriction endonuclease McrA